MLGRRLALATQVSMRDSLGNPQSLLPRSLPGAADTLPRQQELAHDWESPGDHRPRTRPLACLTAGSRDHEEEDARAFADWGLDFLKYDNCWAPASDWVVDRYTAMSAALNKTGRPIVYSMCDWGVGDPWLWAPKVRLSRRRLQRGRSGCSHVKAGDGGRSSRPHCRQCCSIRRTDAAGSCSIVGCR